MRRTVTTLRLTLILVIKLVVIVVVVVFCVRTHEFHSTKDEQR